MATYKSLMETDSAMLEEGKDNEGVFYQVFAKGVLVHQGHDKKKATKIYKDHK